MRFLASTAVAATAAILTVHAAADDDEGASSRSTLRIESIFSVEDTALPASLAVLSQGPEQGAGADDAAAQDTMSGTSAARDDDGDGDETFEERIRAGNFGDEGTWRLNFGGGYGFGDAGDFAQAFVGVSYFIVDDFSFDLQLEGILVDQEGPDAWGGDILALFRWHFYSEPSWSIYFDFGVGFMKTNDDVPDNGSNYNFTPQAGLGVTFDVGNDWRMMLGGRWHHISNADIADSNPGRDSIIFYAGLTVPF